MAGKNTSVFGIYPSAEHAERAVATLTAAGYASSDISVLLPDARSTREFAHVRETKAPEGTAAGVTTGWLGGGTRLSVHCDTSAQISRAKDLLESSGAEDIASSGESAGTPPGVSPGAATARFR
jgi:hypothetical protein